MTELSYPACLQYPTIPYADILEHPEDFYDVHDTYISFSFNNPAHIRFKTASMLYQDLWDYEELSLAFRFFSQIEIDHN
jgi:hypothetical protein